MRVSEFYTQLCSTPTRYLTTINGKRLWIKRDDLNDPVIQGNKLRKLKGILLHAEQTQQGLLSFGGAYSNHIAALAEAGNRFNIQTCGIIRGEELADSTRQSHTIQNALTNGMTLHFVSREAYRQKEHSQTVQKLLQKKPWWIIPEGGSDQWALQGTAEIIDEIVINQDTPIPAQFFCACGTGGTLAGILQGATKHQLTQTRFIGVPVLKGGNFLYDAIRSLNPEVNTIDWTLHLAAHEGGYAKTTPKLIEFIKWFEAEFALPLDPVYTGKLCKAVFELANAANNTPEDWLIYHSGGLQGRFIQNKKA